MASEVGLEMALQKQKVFSASAVTSVSCCRFPSTQCFLAGKRSFLENEKIWLTGRQASTKVLFYPQSSLRPSYRGRVLFFAWNSANGASIHSRLEAFVELQNTSSDWTLSRNNITFTFLFTSTFFVSRTLEEFQSRFGYPFFFRLSFLITHLLWSISESLYQFEEGIPEGHG